LLGFELAPRLKAIARQKLYLPSHQIKKSLGDIAPILSHVIDWKLIERHYDEMVKYTTAMNERTADPESIEPEWAERMTPDDHRGITPLIYSHVNPYGVFDVNLENRISYSEA